MPMKPKMRKELKTTETKQLKKISDRADNDSVKCPCIVRMSSQK